MSTLTAPLHVLVCGYGLVGKGVLDALIDPQYSGPDAPVRVKPFVLVKPASLADPAKRALTDKYTAQGVTVVEGDIEQGAQLSKALKAHSIHTVVSVVSIQQSHLQYALIDAAKAAGVQHFIPSDFGMDYDVVRPGHVLYELLCKPKQELHAAIKQSGMAWTFIATGSVVDAWFTPPMLGTDLATRTVTAPEWFSTTITSTAVRDIGLLTAACHRRPAGAQPAAVHRPAVLV